MRRVDLAEQVLLTASGITRLLDGLEQSGFVERAACAEDRRVVYAVLTDAGLDKLRQASREPSRPDRRRSFGRTSTTRSSSSSTSLLTRLGEGENLDCASPDE